VSGETVGLVELLEEVGGHALPAADSADVYSHGAKLVPAAAQQDPIEGEQEVDLVGGPYPVLGRERVHGHVTHAGLEPALDDVEQCPLPRLVARGARQPSPGRPAAVAVHDEGDVARNTGD
jgi:hypothetical protein